MNESLELDGNATTVMSGPHSDLQVDETATAGPVQVLERVRSRLDTERSELSDNVAGEHVSHSAHVNTTS
jgi:hypothetical protein